MPRAPSCAPKIPLIARHPGNPRVALHSARRPAQAARRTRYWIESLSRCRDVSTQVKLLVP
jgi:hypothetical protein